jgi:hypothetical protein
MRELQSDFDLIIKLINNNENTVNNKDKWQQLVAK